MMRLRFLIPLVGLTSLSVLAVACGDSTETPGTGSQGGEGGGGGSPSAGEGNTAGSTSNAGSGTEAGAAGAAGADVGAGGGCSDSGTGTIDIQVTGLPAGVMPDVSTTGADELAVTEAGPLEDLPAGSYAVTAARVFDDDPRVRTVYDATVAEPEFCLADGETHVVKVTYKAIPTSNKLWLPTGSDTELAGFASANLGASATKAPSIAIDGPGSGSLAFDQDGNMWAFGPTVADAQIARFKAADFATSGKRTPEIQINVPEIGCVPALNTQAFDADGNLWVSACGGKVLRLPAASIKTSGDKAADVTVSGLTANDGIAFDKAGNLWVGGGAKLLRFDAARLSGTVDTAADLSLTVTAAVGAVGIKADEMAFDQAGNLWAVDKGSNHIFQIAEAALGQTGAKAVKANVSFVVGVTALPFGPAFDDANFLWVSLEAGKFGGFSPAQLAVSKGTGAPVTPAVVITTTAITAGLSVAFFPAPSGLPLYHAIPTP